MLFRKLWALVNIVFGLFLIVIVGGTFLLQLLCIVVGFMFLFRGISMLTMARFASHIKSSFFNNDRFE